MDSSVSTIIIGAGQAGLATSYFLKQKGIEHVVLEAHDNAGDSWQNRWDSLRLFSPHPYNNLPGLPFPRSNTVLPTKDEVANYLRQYTRILNLPVKTATPVLSVEKNNNEYIVATNDNHYRTSCIVIATGAYHKPYIPEVSKRIPPEIRQITSKAYKNPESLLPGDVLVVGMGASGSQIALELAGTRKVYLSGKQLPSFPRQVLGKDIYWWLYKTGLLTATIDSWLGKKMMQRNMYNGDALIGKALKESIKQKDIFLVGKTVDVTGNEVIFDDGKKAVVQNIIWATGYRYDFSWIRLPIFDKKGYPMQSRGKVIESPGLYFVGLPYLYRINSSLIGGVGADAQYIAEDIFRHLTQKNKKRQTQQSS